MSHIAVVVVMNQYLATMMRIIIAAGQYDSPLY